MVISLVNQKGGTGKTTSTVNLGSALASLNQKVLLIDLDPQGSLSFSLGIHQPKRTISHLLIQKTSLSEVILPREDMAVIPADLTLADIELSMARIRKREYTLKNILSQITGYDYILLDCPPSLSLLTVNALNACEQVIIPMQMEVLSLKGLENILQTLATINKSLNSSLQVMGVLPVMVDARKNLNGEIKEYIEQNFDVRIFESCIRTNVKASEAPSFGKSVVTYAPYSNSAKDYISLAKEVIDLNYN
jgi:chromosome partitioning protein